MPSKRYTRKPETPKDVKREIEQPPYRFPVKPIETTKLVAHQPPWIFFIDPALPAPNAPTPSSAERSDEIE